MRRTLADYYADPFVRRRIQEYCGATAEEAASCVYLAAVQDPRTTWDGAPRFAVDALETLLAEGADVARSMWDRSNLLVHLDIDYLNVDTPGEAFDHPAEVFFKLEPVYRAAMHVLRRFKLPMFTLMTGRGYHFTGRVPLESDVIDRLASIVPETPSWAGTLAQRRPSWTTAELSARQARAYVGVGMIGEFLAHRILKRAHRRSPIPIVLNGTVVGSGAVGRECASIDISYAGDPLDKRHLRVAFGAYQKHRLEPEAAARWRAADSPPFIAVPRGRESLSHLLSGGREPGHAARTARHQPAALPIVSAGVSRALDAYEMSELAQFHRAFYGTSSRGSGQFDALVRSARWTSLPECVTGPLLAPNDRLLQPAVVQHVTRALMAEGMAPRDIAGVIWSRYAADFNWGGRWFWLDAQSRAEFDVRVFAGLLTTALDRALDFNCRSAQEKGLCPWNPCPHDLRVNQERLLASVRP